MEIEILKNTTTGRLILVDKKTNIAFYSFKKENRMYTYLMKHHSEDIKDYKPTKT